MGFFCLFVYLGLEHLQTVTYHGLLSNLRIVKTVKATFFKNKSHLVPSLLMNILSIKNVT